MPARRPATDLAQILVRSRAELREWLAQNHPQPESIWLVTYKKGSPFYLPYDDIVEEAICFGWIDSLVRKRDEATTMLLLSPRKAGSAWSRVNKDRVARLEAEGLLHPAGAAKIAQARVDGTWDKLNEVDALVEPPDLVAALAKFSDARRHWDAFPPSTRRGILEWILQAKRPETRAKRIAETARLAEDNVRANQFTRRDD